MICAAPTDSRDASLNVALVYDDSLDKFGGIPQYLEVLARVLARQGHTVTLLVGQTVSTRLGESPVFSLARNLGVHFNGNALSMPLMPRFRAIRSVMRHSDFDVMHVQVPYSPLMAGQLIKQLGDRTALVGTFHVASERALPRLGARLLRIGTASSRRRFDEMICVSDYAAAFAQTTFGVRRFTVVPNMIELQDERRPAATPPRAPTVVCVGALVPRKGQLMLVDAFASVLQAIPDAQLVLAGDGPMRGRLERRITGHGIDGHVRLVGTISTEQREALLHRATVACFPSRFGESFGVVLLEAMAADGPAVLAGRNGGYAELLGSIPAALFEPAPVPLAQTLTALLGDERRQRQLVGQQQRLVRRFEASAVVGRIVDVYRSAVARRQSEAIA